MGKKTFCVECRKETEYVVRKEKKEFVIRGKQYLFDEVVAICKECECEMGLPELIDANIKLLDEQYRNAEQLVSVDDINALMEVYNIGKAPLSLALGFGEITITRYLQGMYPSAEYSEIIHSALSNPDYMIKCLIDNKEKVGDIAYKKSLAAANSIKTLIDSVSNKMLLTISYIFERAEEVTPLALQKLLYYVQGLYMVNYGKPLFSEDCQAWTHGPVYEKVYEMFKSFAYSPIDDKRFVVLKEKFHELGADEKEIIDLVINTFGTYSGKTLESITHKEAPWFNAYVEKCEIDYFNEVITKESIKEYFDDMAKVYNFNTEDGVNQYIQNKINEQGLR